MRFANYAGRAALTDGTRVVHVAEASDGKYPAEPAAIFEVWDEFAAWARTVNPTAEGVEIDRAQLGSPSPTPRQVFAIGLNYRDHATESGLEPPAEPPVFTKFPTSVCGPYTDIELPTTTVDYEAELVVVIGRRGHRVSEADAWAHVAGLAIGQDVSERTRQLVGPAPQFSLGKSFPGFGPVGPWLVTADDLADPDDLGIGCSINDEVMQHGRTRDMIFSVSSLIARLSDVTPLLPGDVIFTGTPAGVGGARKPPVFLEPGDVLSTWVDGIGTITSTCRIGTSYPTQPA
jgi:2,4-didehydro-3-deoxy-L-rhamnonate hydrolase